LSTFSSENSVLENIGYGLGALANVSDILAGFKPGNVQLNTEKDPSGISHSAITNVGETDPTKSFISVGPDPGGKWIFNPLKFKTGTNKWVNYVNNVDTYKTEIIGVNMKTLNSFSASLKNVKYNLYFNSCVNNTARGLTLSGVISVGIHPYILSAQMYLRSIGVRPMIFSYYLNK
jgi:hypothetical protein